MCNVGGVLENFLFFLLVCSSSWASSWETTVLLMYHQLHIRSCQIDLEYTSFGTDDQHRAVRLQLLLRVFNGEHLLSSCQCYVKLRCSFLAVPARCFLRKSRWPMRRVTCLAEAIRHQHSFPSRFPAELLKSFLSKEKRTALLCARHTG